MCELNPAELTYYGDKAGFNGPIYTWTRSNGSELVVYALLSQRYRLSCPDGRNFPLPSFDPSSLPPG